MHEAWAAKCLAEGVYLGRKEPTLFPALVFPRGPVDALEAAPVGWFPGRALWQSTLGSEY